MSCGGFRFLEHISDAYVEASGKSIEEAFINAAKALFELITDTSKVARKVLKEVKGEGVDLENALYRWLEELLILHDSEGLVFSHFELHINQEKNKVTFWGSASGEKFDPLKHEVRTEVKSVTYSLMEIRELGNCWVVRVVFDL